MTRTQIVAQVAGRLNLTSPTALARIEDDVKERYGYVLTSVGLVSGSHTTISANTVVGNRYITFPGAQKVLSVFDSNANVLNELTFDEMRNFTVQTDPPQHYAIATIGATSVTLFLDTVPATIYTLSADVEADVAALGPADAPSFPEKFHDILVHGAMAVELDKMEKADRAAAAEARFNGRLAELRYFIAVSAYKDIHQGKTGVDSFPTQLL
jgi:hypothetical protein